VTAVRSLLLARYGA